MPYVTFLRTVHSVLGWHSTSSLLLSRSAENPFQPAFFRLKRLLNVVGCATITGFTLTQIGRCCVWGILSKTAFSHLFEMFDNANMRSRLYPFFHIALLFDSAHSSTAARSLSVEVYPQRHVSTSKWRDQELFSWWFVQGMYHYTGSSTVIIVFTDRNAVNLQTISNINRASMVVVWAFSFLETYRQWQYLSFPNSDSMDALLAVRPSMFADITISAFEEL